MQSYIKKLQSKPEEVRQRILVVSMLLVMTVVVMVWVYDMTGRLSSGSISEQASSDAKPFTLFFNSLSNLYNQDASAGNANLNSGTTNTQKQINLVPVEPQNQ